MKALVLLKHNIDTLLRSRGQTRYDLACWVRQSTDKKKVSPWISHIFTKDDREFQLKYLDRIADFFGLEVYQLFQPGISRFTERRRAPERRSGIDRRIGTKRPGTLTTAKHGLTLSSEDEQILAELHALPHETYQHVRGWIQVAKFGPRNTGLDTRSPARPPGEASPPSPQGRIRGPRAEPPPE